MKFTASLPTFTCKLNKGIIINFGGTEEPLEVQGEAPISELYISIYGLHETYN